MNSEHKGTSVVPTNTDPYAAHWLAMTQGMGRMEGKIDQMLATQVSMQKGIDDHEDRLRQVEKGMWKRTGAASVIAAVLSYFGISAVEKGWLP